MPEVGLGFFPDVGGTFLLSRSRRIGTYFGLTGQTMNGPDAIHARFADVVVSSAKWPELRAALTKVFPVRPSGEIRALIGVCDRGREGRSVAAKQAQIDACSLMTHKTSSAALKQDGRSWRKRP